MSGWQDSLLYALTMARSTGLRYRISAYYHPGKGWQYVTYPAINYPSRRRP